jgi:hypothetical protein
VNLDSFYVLYNLRFCTPKPKVVNAFNNFLKVTTSLGSSVCPHRTTRYLSVHTEQLDICLSTRNNSTSICPHRTTRHLSVHTEQLDICLSTRNNSTSVCPHGTTQHLSVHTEQLDICLSKRNNSTSVCPHGTTRHPREKLSMRFDIRRFFGNTSRKIDVLSKSDKNNGT